jgi:hypothetical protein
VGEIALTLRVVLACPRARRRVLKSCRSLCPRGEIARLGISESSQFRFTITAEFSVMPAAVPTTMPATTTTPASAPAPTK